MKESELSHGFEALAKLAKVEYHQTIEDVAADADRARVAVRVGRLVGVLVKEPFAAAHKLDRPSSHTAAHRSWTLLSEAEIEAQSSTWQYATLERIRSDLGETDPHIAKRTTYELIWLAHNETGFFGYLARSLRKYLCADPEIRQKVTEALEKVSGGKVLTPEGVIATGGLGLGVYLVDAVPLLGMVGAPVIAGLIVIIYTLGMRGFCEWTDQLHADEAEKY